MSSIPISNKRGFGFTGGFWNRFGVVFIEVPIDTITSALSDYFEAQCDRNLSLMTVAEISKKISRPILFG